MTSTAPPVERAETVDVSEILAHADPARYGLASRSYDRCAADLETAWSYAQTRAAHGARSWITDRAHPARPRGRYAAPYRVTGADVPQPAGTLLVIVHPHTETPR